MAQPIMVTVVEREPETSTVVDVLLGAIGLTGGLLILALLLGAAMGGALIAWKRWAERNRPRGPRAGDESDAIHISPYA